MNTRDARLTARNAPDNHQVFIGNLPAGVKDEEVRNVFSSECTCGQINKYIYIYRKSASRFSSGTVLNTLKQSRINIMGGKRT